MARLAVNADSALVIPRSGVVMVEERLLEMGYAAMFRRGIVAVPSGRPASTAISGGTFSLEDSSAGWPSHWQPAQSVPNCRSFAKGGRRIAAPTLRVSLNLAWRKG